MFILHKTKKSLLVILISIFICVQLFGVLAFAKPANAQMDSAITAAFSGKWTWEQVGNSLLAASLGALVNGMSYFMRKMAYDTAMYVSSGGKGKGALAFKQGPAKYFENVAKDAAASAIEVFGEPFGLNLCQTPDLRVQVYLQVGLRNMYGDGGGGQTGPQPRCDWNKLSNSWSGEAFESKYGPGGRKFLAETFSNSLRVEDTDFGIALGAMGKIDRIKANAEAGAATERIEGQGYKALTGLITGNVKTPAQIIKTETEAITAKNQTDLSAKQIAGIYGSGALQIIPMGASVFINTLTGQLLNKLMSAAQGLFSDDSGEESTDGGTTNFFAQYVQDTRKAAAQAFNFLYTAVPQKQLNTYDIISEFAACPDSPSLNNCVIDTQLQQAIERAKSNKPLTIKEAMSDTEKLLNKKGFLISPRREVDNTNFNCYKKGYCYSNLQKLRKARILPIGFELAALKSDPDNPWTLEQVVNGFEDCKRDENGEAIPDVGHPFCHLIDPNWIIRSPEAHCEAKVNGPILESPDTARRQTECVDISTCLAENENGTCASPFSYCLREKNIWQIGGQSCNDYYSTCDTYFDSTGKAVSYLSRTLDFGECNLDAVGCRAYSLEQGAGGVWQNSEQIIFNNKYLSRPQTIFFNKNIDNYRCANANDEGCSAFNAVGADNSRGSLTYLKKAPDYLGCYDINTSTGSAVINWPKTKVELSYLNDRSESCKNFAGVCLPDELGCESYTSGDGGVAIPGIIGSNYCRPECVGYDTYKQEATNFSSSTFPLHFIPGKGTKCLPQEAGCEEFTNIDTVTKGGEGLEYYTDLRYCERPAANNQETYYSWQGSATEGYVLRTHKLLPIDPVEAGIISGLSGFVSSTVGANVKSTFVSSSPAYVDDSVEALEKNYNLCNATSYNVLINNPYSKEAKSADCRALYNKKGDVYYRLLAETVTISEACHPLRKTESELYVDQNISVANCTAKGGKVENSQCLRCYRGGKLDSTGNACIYWTISKSGESVSCTPTAKSCRAYTGNTGNNIKEILFNGEDIVTFEPTSTDPGALTAAAAGWLGTKQVRPESIQVGQYSLGVQGEIKYEFASNVIESNSWYELSFWAKGNTQNLNIRFYGKNATGGFEEKGEFTYNPYVQVSVPATVGAEWQEYSLGPILFKGNGEKEVRLSFSSNVTNKEYYLDNIRLTKIQDHTYLIKNSWKTVEGYDVPLTCDNEPADGLPGVALGCKAYRDSQGTPISATGFEKLCRPEAVGCQEFYDTFNTPNEITTSSYNVWCNGNVQGVCKLTSSTVELGKCEVPVGQTGCLVDKIVVPEGVAFPSGITNASVVTSTIIIPADTPIGQQIYLTNRRSFKCSESALGCTKVALESRTVLGLNNSPSLYDFSETYLKNNPANYSETLCADSLVGCQEFKSGSDITYFKNPEILGSVQCNYKTLVDIAGTKYSGWFRDGVGTCINNADKFCRADKDCGTGTEAKCNTKDPVPCYENYVQAGSNYGVWSNSSDNYKGLVGMCPAAQNGCTELIDPADTSQNNPEGKPYYIIFNRDVEKRTGECEGKVSLKDGCVLFDRTDLPNKIYNVAETYKNSENLTDNKYGSVTPSTTVSALEPKLKANLILKVERDRQCSEWLQCKSYAVNYNEKGQPTNLCEEFKRCTQLNDRGECISWVPENDELYSQTLTEDFYVGRSTNWYAEDFSGYSLLNKYQIGSYVYLKMGLPNEPTFLAHTVDDRTRPEGAAGCTVALGAQPDSKDGDICGLANGGRCWQGNCVYPLEGSFTEEAVKATFASYLEQGSCKAYPEKESPFEVYQATEDFGDTGAPKQLFGVTSTISGSKFRWNYPGRKDSFGKVNICQDYKDTDGNNYKCSCGYVKVTYKNNVTDYWPATNKIESILPKGVCSGGSLDGIPCDPDYGDKNQCGDVLENPGQCSRITERTQRNGQTGFCLEYDLSRPLGKANTDFKKQTYACLTWLPVEVSASGIDTYNYYEKAGYHPGIDANASLGQVFCTESTANGQFTYDTTQYQNLGGIVESKCSYLFNEFGQSRINTSDLTGACGPSGAVTSNYSGDQFGLNMYTTLSKLLIYFDTGLENFQTSFAWLGDKNNYDSGYVTNKNVYTFMQLFGWHGVDKFLTQKDVMSTNGAISAPDVVVWYIKDPTWWVDTLLRLSNTGWDLSSDYFTTRIPHSYSYDINKTIYLNEVRRIYLPSFAFIVDDGTLHGDAGDDMVFTDDIYIDFERLRTNGSLYDRFQNPCVKGGSLTCISVDGPRNAAYSRKEVYEPGASHFVGYEDDETFPYYTFYGVRDDGTEVYGIYLLTQEFLDKYPGATNIYKAMVWNIDRNNNGDIWPNQLAGRYILTWENKNGVLTKPGEGYPSVETSLAAGNALCEKIVNGVPKCEINKVSYLGALIEFMPRCTTFNLVHKNQSNDDYDTKNKAWTNRVWINGAEKYTFDRAGNEYFKRDGAGTSAPYGATALSETDFTDKTVLRKYWYQNLVFAGGFPFACYDKIFSGANFDVVPVIGLYFSGNWGEKAYCSGLLGHISELRTFKPIIEKFSSQVNINSSPWEKGFDGEDALARLFAKSFEIKFRSPTSTDETNFVRVVDGTDNAGDLGIANKYYSDTESEVTLFPPRIYSLNPNTCKTGLSSVPCTYGEENNVTVGNKNGTKTDYNKDGSIDEDLTGDQIPEYNYGLTSFLASVKFYALADENRMPIKRVLVEWGDGSIKDERVGMYRNHLPFCSDDAETANRNFCFANGVNTQLTCTTPEDCPVEPGTDYYCHASVPAEPHFGVAKRACETNIFERVHNYTCTDLDAGEVWTSTTEQLSSDIKQKLQRMGVANVPFVCIFQPKVQVLDNWGWCNGTCGDLTDYGGNNNGIIDGSEFEGCYNNTDPASGSLDCDPGVSPVTNEKHWTQYQGQIIVVPTSTASGGY
ncbi:MAG: hypothetical protein US42_C0003G0044 [Candidatus Magasanikbacteria bacterium GW2011_GWC2_37_14]|uniref:CBM-cenC domain-containing protein n=1 Tax=Candidatus Magasanikbacteria bacterium GW2011_GWC2_37_14 TaxID=1619046 RepID=A0A0G0GDA4_9BACT|nr:MAG: hypothetical protein US42_C0003G0044 [Candidatus Magasanikbacteria bacterium GW2011_GWC2_37_14]